MEGPPSPCLAPQAVLRDCIHSWLEQQESTPTVGSDLSQSHLVWPWRVWSESQLPAYKRLVTAGAQPKLAFPKKTTPTARGHIRWRLQELFSLPQVAQAHSGMSMSQQSLCWGVSWAAGLLPCCGNSESASPGKLDNQGLTLWKAVQKVPPQDQEAPDKLYAATKGP